MNLFKDLNLRILLLIVTNKMAFPLTTDCGNALDEISKLQNELKEIQKALDEMASPNENLNPQNALASSVLKITSEIEGMELSDKETTDKIKNFNLKEKINETGCYLSIKIINLELGSKQKRKESDDAKSNKSEELENLRKKLYATGLNRDYDSAVTQCQTEGSKVFLPKTKEENDLWVDFWRETSENKFLYSYALYPKVFDFNNRKFIWADGYEHPEYYNISVPASGLSLKRAVGCNIRTNMWRICLIFYYSMMTKNCSFDVESTFVICESA